ncbi:DUF7522 family protein [Natronoarchaeum rubrum]|uniref:DUF7522 family protein n=1 Tax=Natronoarchaeum rubrum TaxID=755311 RepID=UPI00211142BB|nr:hypothetical protein [Natronoarchaeum rubrum]HMB50213.1 hypothetical protein [Natronoarchaeum rubrum]
MVSTTTTTEFDETIASACRTAVGDSLRTVIYFTPDSFDVLYVRDDLYDGEEEAVRRVKELFVENERIGFGDAETYRKLTPEPNVEPDVGEYQFTMRIFEYGFLSRVIEGDRGVLTTTDGLQIDAFKELAVTLRKLLAEA